MALPRTVRLSGALLVMLVVGGFVAPAAAAQSLECPTCTLDDTVRKIEETVETVGDAGNDPVTQLPGTNDVPEIKPGSDLPEIDDLPDEIGSVVDPDAGKPRKKTDKSEPKERSRDGGTRPTQDSSYLSGAGRAGSSLGRQSLYGTHEPVTKIGSGTASFSSQSPLTLEEALRRLGEAARKLAFPLGLALAVLAYLVVQGRIDAKDPKLVLAAIDAEDDYFSFQ